MGHEELDCFSFELVHKRAVGVWFDVGPFYTLEVLEGLDFESYAVLKRSFKLYFYFLNSNCFLVFKTELCYCRSYWKISDALYNFAREHLGRSLDFYCKFICLKIGCYSFDWIDFAKIYFGSDPKVKSNSFCCFEYLNSLGEEGFHEILIEEFSDCWLNLSMKKAHVVAGFSHPTSL